MIIITTISFLLTMMTLPTLFVFFFTVSEEKDNPSDDECTEQVLDGVEFEGLDSCSQSAQNKEIKLVTSEDDLSKSDLKTISKFKTSDYESTLTDL